ncbi:Penicillin-binding protein 1C [Oleispira antarctica RB-8]|uniref:peptidoglycan glycosyltransferase n=1 Tax=Oleispira antarctica RB-8 TaxID=698738 RepID=R4YNZ9_OLEAN|nr:Penicillin-binding protein 1C [Oleispira antarctica RB-8]
MNVKTQSSTVKIIAAVCVAVIFSVLISSWWHSLPQPLFNSPYSSILLDRNNQLLEARIASDEQWRFPPSETLPSSYIKAVLLFEDKRFYTHSGVDFLALGRATLQNIKAKEVVSGASTLSMQVIRLASDNQSRTLSTKLIETLQALRLEFSYDKQEILNLYASHAPFGGNVVGISAASWRYFGRAPESLSWAESALLAVLPNRPNYLRPGKNQQKLKQKRDRLLTRLQQAGEFDQLQLTLALSEPLPDKILAFPKRAPHLLETLISRNFNQAVIKTSLNSNLQAQVQSVTNNYAQRLLNSQITHLAAVVLDNKSGLPVAYIGNSGFSHNPHSGKGIDLLHRARSTGSILKPLLYATMLQQGEITPLQLVEDTPTKFKGYQPENYDLKFRGVVPAKQALAQSLNIPAVNMLKQYGIKPFYDFLETRGMSTLHRNADDYGLPLILGGAEGTLWEMTHLYMQLARAAQSLPAQAISRLPTIAIEEPSILDTSHLGAGAAWLTLNALLEVGRPGSESRWRQFSNSRKVAWKTGTSYGFRDGWAIGTTAEYTIGVWTGNAEGGGVPGLTGTQAAAPLLFELFNLLPKTHWFSKPEYDLRQVRVCKNDGFLATPYCDSKVIDLPLVSSYSKISPYHMRIHTDAKQHYRVSSACEPVHKLSSLNWFTLPPHVAFYYQKQHSEYRPMPKWRQDCLNFMSAQSPISFIYPHKGTQIYLPTTMDGSRTKMVSELAHQYSASQVYWYLDQEYLGTTQQIHQMEIGPGLGKHELLVVDEAGNQQVLGFEVLSQ